MKPIYPWQNSQWQLLLQRKQRDNLAHAFLLHGQDGLGKLDFARAFAELLLCTTPGVTLACGQCPSCRLLQADTHSDLTIVQPEGTSKQIKIEQIRNLSTSLQQTAQQGGYKIAIIAPADAMNLSAANSLLKTLEEPEEKTVLLLVTAHPQSLPATIRSRCQMIAFTAPDLTMARAWLAERIPNLPADQYDALLAITDRAPLKAYALAENSFDLNLRQRLLTDLLKLQRNEKHALAAAAEYSDIDLPIFCTHLLNLIWIITKIRCGATEELLAPIAAAELPLLKQLADKLNLGKLFLYFDRLLEIQKSLADGISLNKQLLIEDLFLKW